jgi:hypothetical protein
MDDLDVLQSFEDEVHRRGGYQLVFPPSDSDVYTKFFEVQTYYDKLVFKWLSEEPKNELRVKKLLNLLEKDKKVKDDPVSVRSSISSVRTLVEADKVTRVSSKLQTLSLGKPRLLQK